MAGKSNYLEDKVLNWMKGSAFGTAPTTVYVGLHTADPTDAGGVGEVSGGSYARVAVTTSTGWSSITDDGSGNEQMSNSGTVTFPSPSANWGTVTHFSVSDASTSGNLLYSGTLGTSRNILNGDNSPQFAAGALVLKEG